MLTGLTMLISRLASRIARRAHLPGSGAGARLREERGQIAWGFVLITLVVFMFFALSFDAGLWFFDHRTAQNQVDAAAHAGALALVEGEDPRDIAAEWLVRNGIDDPEANACADGWFDVGDSDDDDDNDADWVWVCQRRSSGLVFAALSGLTDVKVSAEATARYQLRPLLYSLMAMTEHECRALTVSGNGQVVITSDEDEGGRTYTRSDCPHPNQSAFIVSGDNTIVTTGGNDVVGSWNLKDPSHVTPPPEKTNWIEDPFLFLPQPDVDELPVFTSAINQNNSGTTQLEPGVYTQTIRISDGTLELSGGLYVLYGGLDQTGGTITSEGAEVLIYATCPGPPCDGRRADGLSFTGGSLNLTGDSDTYNILFWIDRTSKYNPGGSSLAISGQGSIFLEGIGYAISSHCQIVGQADIDITLNMSLICDTIAFSGQGKITIDYNFETAPKIQEIAIVK